MQLHFLSHICLSDSCMWSKSQKEKSSSVIMPTYPWEPETTLRTWCSHTLLCQAWWWVLQQKRGGSHLHAPEGKPVRCHGSCKPVCCSQAGALTTHRTTFQCASPICPFYEQGLPLGQALCPKLNWSRWSLHMCLGLTWNWKWWTLWLSGFIVPWYSLRSPHFEQLNWSWSDLQPG